MSTFSSRAALPAAIVLGAVAAATGFVFPAPPAALVSGTPEGAGEPAPAAEPGPDGDPAPDGAAPGPEAAAGEAAPAPNYGFTRTTVSATASRPHGKALGDFNGDGAVDVAYGVRAGGAGLYWHRAPAWQRHTIRSTGAYSEDMQTADVDRDGDTDIVAGKASSGLRWYANPKAQGGNPTSSNWPEHVVNNRFTHDTELGDVDRDGRLDIVTEHGVYLQRGPANWQLLGPPSLAVDSAWYGTGVGDLDRDGDLDIVRSGRAAPYPTVWFENPLGTGKPVTSKWTMRTIGPGYEREPWKGGFVVTDLDHDGRADVVVAPMHGEHFGLRWFKAPSSPKVAGAVWPERVLDASFTAVHTFKAVDINRDGGTDLVVVEQEQAPQRRVAVLYLSRDAASKRLQVISRSGGHNTKVADVDGDADLDLLVANHGYYGAKTPLELYRSYRP